MEVERWGKNRFLHFSWKGAFIGFDSDGLGLAEALVWLSAWLVILLTWLAIHSAVLGLVIPSRSC